MFRILQQAVRGLVAAMLLCLGGCASGPSTSGLLGWIGSSHTVGDSHDSRSPVGCGQEAANCASSQLREALAAPRSPKAAQLWARAETQYNAGDLAAAVTTLRRLRDVEPRCTAGLSLEAQIALDRGDRDGCALAAQAASAAHPESTDIQLLAGNLLVQLGERRGGLLALEQAHRLAPHDPRTARSLAAAYIAMRNFPAAESVLKSALLRTPGDAGLSITLARLSETEQRWSHAVFYYDLVFDSRLNDPDWLARRAHSLYQAGQFDRAFSDFELCEAELRERGAWDSLGEFADTCWQLGRDDLARTLRDQLPPSMFPTLPISASPPLRDVEPTEPDSESNTESDVLVGSTEATTHAMQRLESLEAND
ncbi:MAG: tetratricopeptide repeat protein [Planctomycetales bacterium]|nr:tetratricopeptide repeat protein [Planctomycetales bacterium]